jgi:hypothetical protein
MDDARFSVLQYLDDGSSVYLRRSVNVDVAVEAFAQGVDDSKHLIVTDGRISLAWECGKGLSRL